MAIEDIARQLGNGLGETLAVHPSDAPHVRYATVAAVNTDGTLDVTIDGTTLRGVCATTGCVGAQAGMRCVVLRQGPLATVVGLVANTNLADIYLQNDHAIWGRDTGGNARHVLQVTNTNNNVVLGWGGYDASQGATNIYGNDINFQAKGNITAYSRFVEKAALPILWSGALYMSSAHTSYLSEKVSDQNHGIILVWSAYENGAACDYNWAYVVVPKSHRKGNGVGTPFQGAAKLGYKYVYVYDDRLVGWSDNDKTVTWNGLSYKNNYWVLRQVLGF